MKISQTLSNSNMIVRLHDSEGGVIAHAIVKPAGLSYRLVNNSSNQLPKEFVDLLSNSGRLAEMAIALIEAEKTQVQEAIVDLLEQANDLAVTEYKWQR